MKLFGRRSRERIDQVAGVIDDYELPSFPSVIAEALSRIADPEVELADVADLLTMDPGMTARLLRLANSPATGLRNPVHDLRQVVALLGRNQVESMLISAGVRAALPSVASPVFDTTRFWRAAAQRAVVATAVSARLQPSQRSETFTAALLQDMALPVLVDHVEGYDRLLQRWYEGEIPDLAKAEADTFGWDHAAVAGRMAQAWAFPDALLEALTDHHDGFDTDVMVWLRLVAGWHETNPELSREELLRNASQIPQLASLDCEALLDDALEGVDEVASLLS